MAPEDAVLLGHAHDALDAGQVSDVLEDEAMRVADEVDLGDRFLGAHDAVYADLDVGQAAQRGEKNALGGGVRREGGVEKDDHGVLSGRRSTRPFFVVRAG